MKLISSNLLNLWKWKNHGHQGRIREGVELEINYNFAAAGLLHGEDRRKIRWKIQAP